MDKNRRFLIFLDGIINLLIGLILLLFPWGMGSWLGLPVSNTFFYPTLLGAVIFGIGLALMLEWKGPSEKYRGLGLLLVPLQLPLRGMIILWVVALAVLSVGLIEFISWFLHRS